MTGDGELRIRLACPDMGQEEFEAVRETLESGVLTKGFRTARFEEAFARRHDVAHAVAMANGTVALAAMYLALGIGPGDEVILPSMTFIASATSVVHVGAIPVFADVDPETFNLDPRDVANRLSTRTRAILAVHYGGQPADMAELQAIADDADVLLLEDAAEAHGATYRQRPVGGLGRAAVFSFSPTKNITTGEGGMVTTDDGTLAERLRLLRDHGQTEPYRHTSLGFNWRMSEIHAAIGEVQVGKLDAILARKKLNAAWMDERLRKISGVTPPAVQPDREHVFMLYTVLLKGRREHVLRSLLNAGIEGRVYFRPAHTQPIFCHLRADLPVTEEISRRMLSLPFHSLMTHADLEEIATTLADAV